MAAGALTHKPFSLRDRIILSLLIAVVTFMSSMIISNLTGVAPGDLRYSLGLAHEWLDGNDPYLPYKLNIDPNAVPYPFTAVLITMPIVWLPDKIAAGIFVSVGAGILSWLILANKKNWQLMMFASWPLINSIIFYQWAPYIVSMYFTPNLLPFLFTKPQIALPFVLTQKPSRIGILMAILLVAFSIALYPLWPFDWIKTLHNYIGVPPLFVLPLGPLLLLALIRFREKRSWLLVLMALMPQRMVYDQLGVLLVAKSRKQMLFLVICSWISLPALIYFGGWDYMPWGWKNWVLIESYIPGLIVVLLPILRDVFTRVRLSVYKPQKRFNSQ
jgi:hypothetical protein